jgi:toxin HigB-1
VRVRGAVARAARRRSVKPRLTFHRYRTIFPDVIRTFRIKPLRVYFETGRASGLGVGSVERVARMLRALDATARPEQMNLPGHHFHALHGERRWSILVTGNWRIAFGWDGADAIDVDLEDYH